MEIAEVAHGGRHDTADGRIFGKPALDAEWLESDGLGGFASGTVSGERTRRYHAVLLQAATPPTGRIVLVNGFDLFAITSKGSYALSSQRYLPYALSPDGSSRIVGFDSDPWPTWRYRIDDGIEITQELFAVHGAGITALRLSVKGTSAELRLKLRPFLSGRDYHATHHENPAFRFDAEIAGEWVRFSPYPGVPQVHILSSGTFTSEPYWYRNFLYTAERERGLDCVEDLAAPGVFSFDLRSGPAILFFASSLSLLEELDKGAVESYRRLRAKERKRRGGFAGRRERSGDAYIVRRGTGNTIIAGYPWFTDWGRDTFIALRGLCLATGRLDAATEILLQWAGAVDRGMLPNFFPDGDRPAEYNSVDASLWYIVAVHELLDHLRNEGAALDSASEARLAAAIEKILTGYRDGTRFHIGADPDDGLLRAGEAGVQLTWMDAKVNDWVVTPRSGKPVEVEALWINALRIGSRWIDAFGDLARRAERSFLARFWNEERGCLFDVVDCNHVAGTVDASLRPNQILAVGGLPYQIVSGARAARVVKCCEEKLLTPVGLRSLGPEEPGYIGRYAGGPRERDGAYHQGTVWPWLIGPFVEAWVRVKGARAKGEARRRFLDPLEALMRTQGGIGHMAEICDGDEPHRLCGAPFQAWSLSELIRLDREVLAGDGGHSGGSDPSGDESK